MRARAASQQLAHSVLPLYRETDGGRPEPFATCTLIEHAGCKFFVTAAHALEDRGDSDIYFANTASGKIEQVPVNSAYFPVEREQGPKPLDIAVAPVTPRNAGEFDGCRFLAADDFAVADRPDHSNPALSLYFMVGFSASRSRYRIHAQRRRINQDAFPLTAIPSTPEKYAAGALDEGVHLAIDYDERDINRSGKRVVPPRLQGVSGGGMFRFNGLSNEIKLVAIAVEHRRNERIIVGTRIDVVLGLIDALNAKFSSEFRD